MGDLDLKYYDVCRNCGEHVSMSLKKIVIQMGGIEFEYGHRNFCPNCGKKMESLYLPDDAWDGDLDSSIHLFRDDS